MRISLSSGAELEVLTRGSQYLGLGGVWIEGRSMRNPSRPILPEIRTPEGELFTALELADAAQTPDGAVLTIKGAWKADGWMEYMLHTVRSRYRAEDWTQEPEPDPDTQLQIILKPLTHVLEGVVHHGFSCQFRYQSKSRPIYRILDRATWEPGESILESELWVRQGIAPAIWKCQSLEARYSSEWHLPPIEQPNIFQFFPLQAAMQGFTMTAAAEGALFAWAAQPAHIRTLLEKKKGVDALFHWHEHCGDLSHDFESSPMDFVWAEGLRSRTDRLNAHERVRVHVWESLHRQAGMAQERVGTYGVIEEWGMPDFDAYREEGVPALAECGVKTIFIPNEFQNNMNVWGIGNMCCTVDLKPPPSLDPAKIKAFSDEAASCGVKIEMWGNTALSSLTYIHGLRDRNGHQGRVEFLPEEGSAIEMIRSADHPWVRNASGAIEADHYTPVFCAMNLREPKVVDYWHKSWKEAQDTLGIRGIFIDSSFNMSADKFHWRQNARPGWSGGATIDQTHALKDMRPEVENPKAIESQYHAYLKLLAEMQGYGYAISTEDVGLFGISRSGPDLEARLPALALWQESYCDFDPRQAENPSLAFFQGLAYRVMWKLYWNPGTREVSWRIHNGEEQDKPTPWQVQVLKAFTLCNPLMVRRTVLEDESGVLWESPLGSCLWSFQELAHTLPEKTKVDLPLSQTYETSDEISLGPLQIAIW